MSVNMERLLKARTLLTQPVCQCLFSRSKFKMKPKQVVTTRRNY